MFSSLLCWLVVIDMTSCDKHDCCEYPCVCHFLELEFLGGRTRGCHFDQCGQSAIHRSSPFTHLGDTRTHPFPVTRQTTGFGHRGCVCRMLSGWAPVCCSGGLVSPFPWVKKWPRTGWGGWPGPTAGSVASGQSLDLPVCGSGPGVLVGLVDVSPVTVSCGPLSACSVCGGGQDSEPWLQRQGWLPHFRDETEAGHRTGTGGLFPAARFLVAQFPEAGFPAHPDRPKVGSAIRLNHR